MAPAVVAEPPAARWRRRPVTPSTPARRLALLLAAAAAPTATPAWRQFSPTNTAPWCDQAASPRWPFAYSRPGDPPGTSSWEPKGRTTSTTTSFGHACALRGARSTCHVCEPFACGPGRPNETCALQLQGAAWGALPVNVPTVTDAPFAVGAAVRHRYDFGAAARACVFLSGGGCLRAGGAGGLTDVSGCALRCWSPWANATGATVAPSPTATGWHWRGNATNPHAQGGVATLAGGGGGSSAGYADAPAGAGAAAARFAAPQGVAVDPRTGVTYAADADNHVIRAMAPDGAVTTLAGQPGQAGFADGPAGAALFSSPAGVATYRDCGVRLPPPATPGGPCATALLVADAHNHRIRLIDLATGVVSTVAGGGGANSSADLETAPFGLADGLGTDARLDTPMGLVADDAGNVFVADTRNAALRWVNGSGHVRTLVGRVDTPAPRELPGCPPPCAQGRPGALDGNLTVARLTAPYGVALGPGRPYTLLVTDGPAVRLVTRAGQDPWAAVRPPHHGLPVPGVTGGGTPTTATDADILSLDTVVTLARSPAEDGDADGDGGGGATGGGTGEARLDTPRGVVASLPDGRVYVADALRCRVRVVTAASVAAAPVGCATRAVEVVAPPGCGSGDPPADSRGRMVTAVRGDARLNYYGSGGVNTTTPPAGGVFDGAAVVPSSLDGRAVPFCLGAPPPDVGNTSTSNGTTVVPADVDEDTWTGSTRLVVCPPGCAVTGGGAPYPVYGDAAAGGGGYDTASPVCAAAVHAGALDDAAGGVVTVTYGKGAGPLAGRHAPASAAAGLTGSTRNGVTSLPLLHSVRTFTVAAVTAPTRRIIVETVAGSPTAPLESGCGYVDGSPPTAARFAGPAGVALDRDAPLSAANPLRIADAHNHAVRTLSPPCALPCENGGVCVGTDVCACAPGWAGVDCTAPECAAAPCGPRRLCTGPDECSCVPGYGGASCDVPLCMQACAHGGACVAPDTCACAPGWFDTNCTTPVCAQTCGNGGNCTAPDVCTCPSWWAGADCRTPVCAQGCSGHGTCTAPNTCTCDPSWSGHDCSKPVCHQGYFRADDAAAAAPMTYAPPGTSRPPHWDQFLPCDYDAWCNATGEFECRQAARRAGMVVPAPYPLQRNVSGWWATPPPPVPGTGDCIALELDKDTRYPYRLQDETGGVSPYARLSPLSQYGWGPRGAHPWSAPGPAANDRQVALVTFARVPQGVYVCAHGGSCTAPDYCVCAPGWGGFDCRTPVCAQGFYYPRDYLSPGRFADARFPEQGVYLPSTRTLSLWEHPPTPGGKFTAGYMHAHPNFHSLPKDADPSSGLADAYTWVAGRGNDTNEGWRRGGWYVRARAGGGLIPWQRGNPAVMAPRYARSCDLRAPRPVDLRTGAPPSGAVDDTFAAFGPRATYNDSAVASSGGWWTQAPGGSAECVDAVRLGCFNGGTCVAPDTCACAPGWTGVDCSLPLCAQATGAVTTSASPDVPLTLVRAGDPTTNNLPATSPPRAGDAVIAYYTCPHGGNCTQPGVCTCEKGWGGPNCTTPLCAQECLNGGNCTAPDVCTCPQWPSTARDARGVPAYRKPDGAPQDTGWTGFDCGTPVCVQAAGWVPNDDTGRRLVVLEGGAANDGKSFQGGCGAGISRFAVSATRVSPRYLCGLTAWWMGNYRDPAANDDDDASPSAPSRSSAGRVVRINTPNYVRVNTSGGGGGAAAWVAGPPLPGEGLYACAHSGACVAPDVCTCADGWSGPDCTTPLCRHVGPSNEVTSGCANGGVCAGKDVCACATVPSLLWQVHPAAPRSVVTGWAGSNCTKPICAQGTFQEGCRLPSDGSADPGCWVCPHGGNCTAPDTCSCPPAWSGYDCTTPVCTLHASSAIRAQLATRDPDKVTAFEQDPCGARQRVALPDGRHVPRGACVAPGVCECLCKRRAVGGERPWVDPLGRPIPPGFVHGAGDCLDGYTGAINTDGTMASCHLAIYVPSWLERNTVYLAAFCGVGALAGVLLYLLARRQLKARHRRLKAARRRRRQQLVVPGAVGGSGGGGSSGDDDGDGTGGRRHGGAGASAARSRRHSASTGAFTARFKWAAEPVAPAPPEGEDE
jgi:hypothetical protein